MADRRRPALVMGGSGFLGSHIVRQLVARGDAVRVWTRPSSATRAFAGLDVEHVTGELTDAGALAEALSGVDVVHYCVVDTRPGLADPAPLFRTNVALLQHIVDAVLAAGVERFVFCSTVGTVGSSRLPVSDEDSPHDWAHRGGPYVRSRVAAEELVLRAHRERGLPAVVLCVGTTYGPHDHGPSPHGSLVRAAALGRVPFYVRGARLETVDVRDAAGAFLLAAERGRPGERYVVSERVLSFREVLTEAAQAAGHRPPRVAVPLAVVRAAGRLGDAAQRVLRRDAPLTSASVWLMHAMPALDHGKAVRELGWQPAPAQEGVRAAARWFAASESENLVLDTGERAS